MFKSDAWLITGGLNKRVDRFIGNEVEKIQANKDKILHAVLGISNWGCLAEKKNLLSVKYSSSLAPLLAHETAKPNTLLNFRIGVWTIIFRVPILMVLIYNGINISI